MAINPYAKTLIDEASELEFPNEKHTCWNEGYEACKTDMQMLLNGIDREAKRLDQEIAAVLNSKTR